MLQCLKDVPFKSFNLSNIRSGNMPLFDIFISMFLQELDSIVKKGLKSDYINTQENSNFYKGKLIVSKHIVSNLVHKERFYIEFDDYSRNRPENKIIKAALLFLNNKTNNINLQSHISKFLFTLDDIETSKDFNSDFSKCTNNRLMGDYDKILKWCRIFLKGESFTCFKGSSVAYALLFTMEKVFESYIAKSFRTSEYFTDYVVKTQDRRYYLIEKPKKFALKPDIVLEREGKVIILDTKWKLLNDNQDYNYGISQSDLYQMYAYAKKYNSNDIFLLYPMNDSVMHLGNGMEFIYEDNIRLKVFFIDLENVQESLKGLAGMII
jgi:5-methylcytosine-specific restriction enzyme subunit McrC